MDFFNPVPSLKFMAAVRVASTVIYSPDINGMILQEDHLPPCTEVFNLRHFELWESIEERVKALLPSYCPPLLRETVSKFLRPMNYEFCLWFFDHNFQPQDANKLKSCLSWHSNGTIDRIETTKNIARNENLDLETRFVVSCTYFLEEEILVLYDKILALNRSFSFKKGNAATRFWVKMLNDGTVSSWKQLASGFFKGRSIRANDSLLRLSSFFEFLSPTYKKVYFRYFFRSKSRLQMEDFHSCLLKLDDKELSEVCSEYPFKVLTSTFSWPYQCIALETAKYLLDKMNCYDFQFSLIALLAWIVEGFDHFNFRGLLRDFWNLTPDAFKRKLRKNRPLMKEIRTVLNCGENSTAKSVGKALNRYLNVDPKKDLL